MLRFKDYTLKRRIKSLFHSGLPNVFAIKFLSKENNIENNIILF